MRTGFDDLEALCNLLVTLKPEIVDRKIELRMQDGSLYGDPTLFYEIEGIGVYIQRLEAAGAHKDGSQLQEHHSWADGIQYFMQEFKAIRNDSEHIEIAQDSWNLLEGYAKDLRKHIPEHAAYAKAHVALLNPWK